MMETCNCGVPFFTFTKFVDNKKYESRKCGFFIDFKKKKICEYNKDIFISDINFKNNYTNLNSTDIPLDYKEDTRTSLNKYIYLYEISSEKGIKTGNISANINFLLKKLKYKLFFDDTESIENLKKRLCNLPDNIIPNTTFKPIKLLEVPDELKVETVSNKKSKPSKYNNNFCFISYKATNYKDDDVNSNSSSEYNENDEFDVEKMSDSDYEDNNEDNFSD